MFDILVLSVCPSRSFFVQMNEYTIMRSSVSGRKIILVSGDVKFTRLCAGVHRSSPVGTSRDRDVETIPQPCQNTFVATGSRGAYIVPPYPN